MAVSWLGRLAALAPAAALLAALSACSVFSGPPPETYQLTAPHTPPGGGGSTHAQILVPEAAPLQALDSNRILVTNGVRITYYPDAQWPDRLPRVVQAKIIEALERSGRVRAAGRPGEGLRIDYQLLTDIRAFEFDTGAGKDARVEFHFRLMDDRDGRIVGDTTLAATVPVAADNAPTVVAALDAALDAVLADLVRWVVREL